MPAEHAGLVSICLVGKDASWHVLLRDPKNNPQKALGMRNKALGEVGEPQNSQQVCVDG